MPLSSGTLPAGLQHEARSRAFGNGCGSPPETGRHGSKHLRRQTEGERARPFRDAEVISAQNSRQELLRWGGHLRRHRIVVSVLGVGWVVGAPVSFVL